MRSALIFGALVPLAAWMPSARPHPPAAVSSPAPLRVSTPIKGIDVGPRRAAVEKILEVELKRLQTALRMNWQRLSGSVGEGWPASVRVSPRPPVSDAPSPEQIATEMEARQPILHWATTQWMSDFLGVRRPGVWSPALKKLELLPWQWMPKDPEHPMTPPTLGKALQALRPTLESEIRLGLRSSPLRVARLAWRAAVCYALAALTWLPGPLRPLIQRTWPRLVEHLATTIETNHREAMLRSRLLVRSSTTSSSRPASA
jgi:hypothetical protein